MSRSSIRCMIPCSWCGLLRASCSGGTWPLKWPCPWVAIPALSSAAARGASTATGGAAALTALAAAIAAHRRGGERVGLRVAGRSHSDHFADDDLGPFLQRVGADFRVD